MNWQELEEAQMLRKLYWYSFVVRLSLGITGWLMMQLTQIELLQDAVYYEEVGHSIASDWLSGRSSTWLATQGHDSNRPVFIVLVVAVVYTLTLGVRVLPLVLAVYLGHHGVCPGTDLSHCQGVRRIAPRRALQRLAGGACRRPSSSGPAPCTKRA